MINSQRTQNSYTGKLKKSVLDNAKFFAVVRSDKFSRLNFQVHRFKPFLLNQANQNQANQPGQQNQANQTKQDIGYFLIDAFSRSPLINTYGFNNLQNPPSNGENTIF